MLARSLLLTALAGLAVAFSGVDAAPPNKCVVNGTVTYQQGLCPSGQVRRTPTIEELNAEEKKRRAAVAAAAPEKAAPVAAAPEKTAAALPAASVAVSGFRCDGRRYCSQMKSCAEAKYFLSNCPGVKMDGDRDGIPCEEQWCGVR
jgi:hypothetical protein